MLPELLEQHVHGLVVAVLHVEVDLRGVLQHPVLHPGEEELRNQNQEGGEEARSFVRLQKISVSILRTFCENARLTTGAGRVKVIPNWKQRIWTKRVLMENHRPTAMRSPTRM